MNISTIQATATTWARVCHPHSSSSKGHKSLSPSESPQWGQGSRALAALYHFLGFIKEPGSESQDPHHVPHRSHGIRTEINGKVPCPPKNSCSNLWQVTNARSFTRIYVTGGLKSPLECLRDRSSSPAWGSRKSYLQLWNKNRVSLDISETLDPQDLSWKSKKDLRHLRF